MSVDADELERGALRRKDREQLLTIATALGRKPPTRARKDQIIDLILELTSGAAASPATAGSSDAPPNVEPQSTSDASAEPLPFDTGQNTSLSGPERDTVAPTETPKVTSFSPFSEEDKDPVRLLRQSAAMHRSGSEPTPTETLREDRPGQGEPVDHAERTDQRDDERDDQSDQQSGDGQNEREGGGRRRRRRGRDKDRDRSPALQSVQPPPNDRDGRDRDNRDRDNRDRDNRDRSADDGSASSQPNNDMVAVDGHLDLRDEGYGFLRVKGYLPSKDDVYVPAKFVRQFALRKGDRLTGASRPAGRGEKNPALLRIDEVNGLDAEQSRSRPRFEDLTPLFPDENLKLERPGEPTNMTARIIDLISPIGKGQRGLIVSPPKAGKTTIMKTIAKCIEANNPEVKLIVLLVDERPEEVTDMRRSVQGEVVASTFDRPADEHTHVAEMTLERAKRLVECGEDVVIIVDGITRLARAYNLAAPATGRVMSGGIDTGALYPPKKFFGAARNVEEGGSLTILATALVETGSRMDEVIFEEFKGTGNMELRLDRRLAEKRIYPAIDVDASSTRHEELLFDRRQLNQVWKLRRVLSGLAGDGSGAAGLELLVDRMKTFKSNDEFLAEVAKAPSM